MSGSVLPVGMKRLARLVAVGAMIVVALLSPVRALAADLDESVLRSIPIQDQGRVKPLDTFSREAVFFVTGKERFEGRRPLDVLLGWLKDEKGARELKIIEVPNVAFRQHLGIADSVRWISIAELEGNEKWQALLREARRKQQAGQDLVDLDKQATRVSGRIQTVQGLVSGQALTLVPNPAGPEAAWIPMGEIMAADASHPDHPGHDKEGTLPPAVKAVAPKLKGDMQAVVRTWGESDQAAFTQACATLKKDLAEVAPASVPSDAVLARELQYNTLDPFGKSWMIYLAALLVLVAASATKGKDGKFGALYWVGYAMAVGGLVMHTYGFALRCMVSGRAPVTNMYESVVWVSFGAILFALVLEAVYRKGSLLMSACVLSILCLILANNSSVLDPAINPLMPVLRNNFWLTIHVLTITISYAAFLLAFGMAHVQLWNYAFHPSERARQASLYHQMYRTIQIGILLLAAGTILGGVWANYSWGRFWGWDPKEVWALIALLGYLAVLHGRYAGWLKDFGVAVGAIIAFLGVLMAWYGVNYVLGAGLHAYGFGEGGQGQGYVAACVAADLAFVALFTVLARRASARLAPTEVPAEKGRKKPR